MAAFVFQSRGDNDNADVGPHFFYWGTPLGVPQYWFDQTWGKWAIIEGDNFFFINSVVALSGRIWSELPDSNADGCF